MHPPDLRHQSAREFGDSLAGYLFNRQLKVTSYDLANLVTAAVSETGGTSRTDKSIMDELIQDELNGGRADLLGGACSRNARYRTHKVPVT